MTSSGFIVSAGGGQPVPGAGGVPARLGRRDWRRVQHRTGLAAHVAGWVISEGVGIRKPEPGIFQQASRQSGQPLTDAWMIGDSAEADIGGAHRTGLPNVWLHRTRTWTTGQFRPTKLADNCPQAIEAVVAADR